MPDSIATKHYKTVVLPKLSVHERWMLLELVEQCKVLKIQPTCSKLSAFQYYRLKGASESRIEFDIMITF